MAEPSDRGPDDRQVADRAPDDRQVADRGEVIDAPESDHWRPEQALAVAVKTGWEDVLIVGFDETGVLRIYNSRMTIGEKLYLLKEVEYETMGVR